MQLVAKPYISTVCVMFVSNCMGVIYFVAYSSNTAGQRVLGFIGFKKTDGPFIKKNK